MIGVWCEYCSNKKCEVICHRVGLKEWCGGRCCKCLFRGLDPIPVEVRE